jgi:hypothetical protein
MLTIAGTAERCRTVAQGASETLFQFMQSGNVGVSELPLQVLAQGLFAISAGCQGENANDQLAGRPRLQALIKLLPDLTVGRIR